MSNIRKRLPLITHYSLLITLFLYILAGTYLVPFHGDESTILYGTVDYAFQFINGDVQRLFYHPAPPDGESALLQELRMRNGSVSKYLGGFAWHISGYSAASFRNSEAPERPVGRCPFACVSGHLCTTLPYQACWARCKPPP